MKFIITTESVKDQSDGCHGCVFELTDEFCDDFCPGDESMLVITKIEPYNFKKTKKDLTRI